MRGQGFDSRGHRKIKDVQKELEPVTLKLGRTRHASRVCVRAVDVQSIVARRCPTTKRSQTIPWNDTGQRQSGIAGQQADPVHHSDIAQDQMMSRGELLLGQDMWP
ncbi:hypothetical protein BSY18_4012 (plasmid) [Blastomonas sp. RAC04]|nr:hypothetical protein BSY18_4012 [Blastomonas sp. RAC04]